MSRSRRTRTSDRTRHVRKLKWLFLILSTLIWIGTAVFMAITVFISFGGNSGDSQVATDPGMQIITDEAKNLAMSVGVTTLIGCGCAIIIKEKLRTVIWMAATILGAILFKEVGMYAVLALWFVDEYILFALYKHYKNALQINKEIDLRG